MKRKTWLLIFFSIFTVKLFCNESVIKDFSVGINVGLNLGAYKESTCSVVTQKILAPKIGLDFKIKTEDFLHIVQMEYSFINPISNQTKQKLIYKEYDPITGEPYISEYESNLVMHRINFAYDMQYLINKGAATPVYVGGSFQTNAYLQFENYPSITGLISLGPSVSGINKFGNRNTINWYGTIPVFGYGIRPPFAGCDALLMKYAEEDPLKIITLGSFLSLHNYQAIFTNIEYFFDVNSWLQLSAGLDFEYSRIAVPEARPLYYCTGNIKAGAQVSF